MRKIYILSAILMATLATCACEDFLDKSPEENLTVDDIFSNREYTKDFLSHVYSWIPTEANMADDGGAWRDPFVAGCDEMECAFGGAYGHNINSGAWNPTTISKTQVWEESYMALRKTNMFLERVDNSPASEEEIRHWKGEAYFLRAYFHFLAFRTHGPIILADHCYDPSEDLLSIRRSSVEECVDFMVQDCQRAIDLLYDVRGTQGQIDKWVDSDTGRATRLSAYGLMSRILLYAASPLYNGNAQQANLVDPVTGENLISQTYDPEKWKLAADAARDCITACKDAGRSLFNRYPTNPVKNYQSIFTECWNEEILWAKNIGTYDHWLNCADPISFNCYSILNPTQNQVDAYETAEGVNPITGYTKEKIMINGSNVEVLKPIINPEAIYTETGFAAAADNSGMDRWPAGVSNMYVNREPRFYASINFNGAKWKWNAPNYNTNDPHYLEFWYTGVDGKNNAGSDYCKTGYLMKKLVSPDRIPWKYTPLLQWVYIRLGEIYLNLAEAVNEYSGPTQECYDAINAIRNRAGLPDLPSGLSKEEMRDRIKHERRIELAFETHRFFDVRRWLDAEKSECQPVYSMNIYAGTNLQDPDFYQRIKIEDRVFEAPKHYFFPISQTEINKNQKGYLVQNLGWITQKTEEEED